MHGTLPPKPHILQKCGPQGEGQTFMFFVMSAILASFMFLVMSAILASFFRDLL